MKTFKLLASILAGCVLFSQCAEDSGDSLSFGEGTGVVGVAGSTARFAIANNYLFLVNDTQLKAFEITNPQDPTPAHVTELGRDIETIFGYRNHLFIGGQNGMQIFELLDGGEARFLSQFTHQQSCDPVIANDEYAYITLRGGTVCRNWEVNELITVDISNLRNPFEVSSVPMINPRGLTFFQGDLYVAEGDYGLKRFSLENPEFPELDTFFTEIKSEDMIGLPGTLIITHEESIQQFGYEQDSLVLLSTIHAR